MEPKPNVQRRGEKKSKGERRPRENDRERVVRDTVSFTKPAAEREMEKPPALVKPVPSYTSVPSKKPEPDDDDDDGYGDDFEDYDDDFDFEEDEDNEGNVPPSRSSTSSVPKLAFSTTKEDSEMKQIRKSMEMENISAISRQNNRTPNASLTATSSPSPTFSSEAKSSKFNSFNSREDKNPQFSAGKSQQHSRKAHTGLMGFASKQSIAFAPRIKRLEALKASGVLSMSDDKSLQLNIAPSTPYEFYHRQLFSASPRINQMGVPVELSRRDMEVNTDEVVKVDKEMQYVYGDDTSLLNAIAKVMERKNGTISEEKNSGGDDEDIVNNASQKVNSLSEENGSQNSNRLNSFLQASSQLCEDLLQEQSNTRAANRKDSGASSSTPISLFTSEGKGKRFEDESGSDADKLWIHLGGDQSEGSNELVRTRSVSSVCFSPLQAHLLMSSHPYREDDEEDLRPYRGIYCVWSTTMPGAPSVVLEASGQPTCCSFSGSQTFIVIGGTAEGTLHLWDLRESNSLHANRDTIDLRIAKGLRKPCYSTHNSLLSSSDGHTCPITQVKSLSSSKGDDAAASVSQFISMDSSGKAILWVTSQTSSDTIVSNDGVGKELDFGLSPWGKVRLLQQRALSAHIPSHPSHGGVSRSSLNFFDDLAFPSAESCLAIIPGNNSAFLFSAEGGAMKRVVRYGQSGGRDKSKEQWCKEFTRLHGDPIDGILLGGESKDIDFDHDHTEIHSYQRASFYQPAVTCIAVNNSPQFESAVPKGISVAPLALVGRVDGSIDLFRLDCQEPIQSWDLSLYSAGPSKKVGKSARVVYIQWVTWGDMGSFVAADAGGDMFFFNIMQQASRPIIVGSVHSPLSTTSVDLSSCRFKGMGVYMALGQKDSTVADGALRIRKIDENISAGMEVKMDSKDDHSSSKEIVQPPQWASWVGRTSIEVSPWRQK